MMCFSILKFGNAVAQQPADAVGLFVDRDRVPGATQLLRRGQPRRTGADDRDFLAGAKFAAARD